MPQLLSGGGSQSGTSGLVEAAGGVGVSAGGGSSSSSSSSRASSQGSSASQRFRAVVAISSDEDRDRVFYEDSPEYQYYRTQPPSPGGTLASDRDPGVVVGQGPVGCPPPPPPPKPPARPQAAKPQPKPPAKLPKTAAAKKKKNSLTTIPSNGNTEVDAMTSLGIPEAASRWCAADGSLPKVVAHENGAIVNGYLLVNGTDSLDVPAIENGSGNGETGSGPPKRFHVTGMLTNGKSDNGESKERSQVVVESTFAGSRDVKDPDTLRDKKIVSAKGTIRGVKNRVRAGIATFLENQDIAKVSHCW